MEEILMEHMVYVDIVKEDDTEEEVEVYFDIDEFNELMDKEDKIDFIKNQTKAQYKDIKKVYFKKKDLKELQGEIDDICDPSDMLPNESYEEYMEHEDLD